MLPGPNVPSAKKFPLLFILAAAAITLWGLLLAYPDKAAVFGQEHLYFDGPDDYMRTWRAKQIADGSAIRIRHIAEINYPAGAELHWTAPMDHLLAGAGLAFGPLFIAHTDPFGCVAAWTPLGLGVIYLVYMMIVIRRGFGWQPAMLVGLMIVLSPSWHRVFRIGHPDHHCLIALLLLFALGAWIAAAREDASPGQPSRWTGFLGGLAMGAAIWVSVESMVFWLAMVVALWAACTFGPTEERGAYAKARVAWNCGTFLMVAAAHVIENWPDFGVVAADKVSLLYVVLVAIGLLVLERTVVIEPCGVPTRGTVSPTATQAGSLHHNDGRSQARQYIALLVGLATLAIWVWLRRSWAFEYVSRPEFLRWNEQVMELRPLYVHADSEWSLRPLHSLMGFLPYALPVFLVFFVRCKHAPRAAKYGLALLAPTIATLTVFQLRWIDHYDLALVPVAVIGAWELVGILQKRVHSETNGVGKASTGNCGTGVAPVEARTGVPCGRLFAPGVLGFTTLLGVVVLLALLVFPSAKTVLTYSEEDAVRSMALWRRTDLAAREILAYEREHPKVNQNRRAILSEDGEGPALLYWTGLPVVATPYHRALDGLLAAAKFFAERDPAQAREQLDRLGVRYVVMPSRAHEQLMQFERLAFGKLRSFDPPTESIDQFGRLTLKLNYRPREAAQTMAYRLVMESKGEAIPGVERITEINEGAKSADGQPMKTGLLYVVHGSPPASQAGEE